MTEHSPLVWDQNSERFYETGCSKGVLYLRNSNGAYPKGVAWNGLTEVKESNDGADAKSLYANDTEYLKLRAKEKAKGTISAYTYPKEFAACDGSAMVVEGVYVRQQTRSTFGLCYRTAIGNDVDFDSHAYKIHLLYGATVSPTERDHKSETDDPEAESLSWSYEAVPVDMPSSLNLKPSATIEIDSRDVDGEKLAALEKILYGSDTADAMLPSPSVVFSTLGWTA